MFKNIQRMKVENQKDINAMSKTPYTTTTDSTVPSLFSTVPSSSFSSSLVGTATSTVNPVSSDLLDGLERPSPTSRSIGLLDLVIRYLCPSTVTSRIDSIVWFSSNC